MQAVEGGSELSGCQSDNGKGDICGNASFCGCIINKEHAADPYALFDQLGKSRKPGLLYPVAVTADTAVYRRAWQGIRDNKEELFAARVAEKAGGDHAGVTLNEKDFDDRECACQCESDTESVSGFTVSAQGDVSCHSSGKGGLYAGSPQSETETVDGEDELIEPYIFLPEGMT